MDAFVLPPQLLQAVILRALVQAFPSEQPLVWEDGADALELDPHTLSVRMEGGWLLAHIRVRCDERGDAALGVAFFLGRPGTGEGPEAASALAPDCDPELGERWGPAFQQLVWNGLLDAMEMGVERIGGVVRGFLVGEDGLEVRWEAMNHG